MHSPLPGTKVGPEPEQDAAMGCHLNIDVLQPLHPVSGQLSAGEPCAMGQTDDTVPQKRIMRCQQHQKGCTRLGEYCRLPCWNRLRQLRLASSTHGVHDCMVNMNCTPYICISRAASKCCIRQVIAYDSNAALFLRCTVSTAELVWSGLVCSLLCGFAEGGFGAPFEESVQ